MKRKSSILVTALTAMMIFSLTACGSTASSTASAADDAEKTETSEAETSGAETTKSDATITFGSHQSGIPTSGVLQELADEFEAETGIKVDFQITPDDQWRDLLKTKLDSGEAYDIMCVDADPLSLYSRINPEQNCVDLSSEEWVSRMDENVIPDVSYKGVVYGMQIPGTRVSGIIYNKEIFEQLSLEIPHTYEEWKNVCQVIKDSGLTPIYEANSNGWHQVLPLFETGPYYASLYDNLYEKLNNNEMKISDVKELRVILDQMMEFANLGFYEEDFISQSVEGGVDVIGTGKAAMMYNTTSWIGEVVAAYPEMDGKLGIFCPPWADSQVIGVNPTNNAYFINQNRKYVEEAKAFLEFLAKPENLKKRLDKDVTLTSTCWPEIPSKETNEDVKAFLDSMPQGVVMQVGVSYIDPQWMDVGKDIDAMYTGTMTADQVFQNIEDRRTEQAELQQNPAWN